MKNIDLHTHSIISDGSYTPTQLMRQASEINLGAIALTDHDTIDGLAEARQAAKQYGIDFLTGMEISVQYMERQLHIVALGFDETNPVFLNMYRKQRQLKEEGMLEIIDNIKGLGADISEDKVRSFCKGTILDRYAIMRYFVSLQIFDDVQKIWDTYINPALQNRNRNISAVEAFAAVKAAGGITSLAHFHKKIGLLGLSRVEQEHAISQLCQLGLDGMEAYYPNYSAEDRRFAEEMITKYNMIATGGTDFHGKNRPAVSLGTGINGNLAVPYELYINIKKRCQ